MPGFAYWRLARAEYGVFQCFSGGETQGGARRNLDLLAGGRIAPYTRLELALPEHSEAGQAQQTLFLKLSGDQLVEFVKCGFGLALGDTNLVGQVSGSFVSASSSTLPNTLSILNKMNERGAKFKMVRAFTRTFGDDFDLG
jgi:hypothetical protein